jgi:aryl-alcohol dehydrogenase-like predicted oxidoreductase
MQYRTLGRTGLSVSEVGLGTLSIGGPFKLGHLDFGRGEVDDKNSRKMIQVALDAGVNFIDTADIYGYGRAEETVGEAVKGRREKVVISTKVGNRGDDKKWYKDFSAAWVREACLNSLKRLQTDYIDLYLLHSPDTDFMFTDEIFSVFNDLKKEGKIRFYGCSVVTPQQGMDFIRAGFGDVVETVYNVCEREAAEELLPAAEHADAGVIVKAPLASGLLTGKYSKNTIFDSRDFRKILYSRARLNRAVDAADYIKALAADLKLTLPQFALKYSLTRKEISTLIPGAKTAGQILENVRASGLPELPVSVLDKIERELAPCAPNRK